MEQGIESQTMRAVGYDQRSKRAVTLMNVPSGKSVNGRG